MIKTMNHVGISVRNIERSVAFYRDLFGMEVLIEPRPFSGELYEKIMALNGAAGKVALLKGPGMKIELFEFTHPSPQVTDDDRPVCDHGISHFCIEVTDIDGEYQRLKELGVPFHCPPQSYRGLASATYGRDPDGNVFELLEVTRSA